MKTPANSLRILLATAAGAAAFASTPLHAQHGPGPGPREPHVDVGLSIGIPLPNGFLDVSVGRDHYYMRRGIYYHRGSHGMMVVRPPRGAIIRTLPPYCPRFFINGLFYYRYGDVYYRQVPEGYVICEAPVTVVQQAPAPKAAAEEYQSVWVGEKEYLFKDGQFFIKTAEGLVWTEAPTGAVTKTLPSDVTSVWFEENEYFESDGVYFRKTPDGYKVVTAPWKK
jgi:hypothetical protein